MLAALEDGTLSQERVDEGVSGPGRNTIWDAAMIQAPGALQRSGGFLSALFCSTFRSTHTDIIAPTRIPPENTLFQ